MDAKTLHGFIKEMGRVIERLTKGDFDGAQKLLQPVAKFGDLEPHAEALSMLGVKLEAKEFSLTEKIKELKKMHGRLQVENRSLKKELRSAQGVYPLQESFSLREMTAKIERIARSTATVLIAGESGTGKEVVAKTIHQLSDRKDKPFVALNCAALPESLLEAELFGIGRGVATGVIERKGKFELADHGTLFLDEIGDMAPSVQAKLLRVLQEREVVRVGAAGVKPIDIRVIAATNKNLQDAVARGAFREDLFFRLNVINLDLPPLRERTDDILPLAHFFMHLFAEQYNREVNGFSPAAENCLLDYPWPGNVRELKNAMERAVLITPDAVIDEPALSLKRAGSAMVAAPAPDGQDGRTIKEYQENEEKQIILRTLARFKGSRNETASALGLHRETLRLKMRKYRIVWRKGILRPDNGAS